MGIDIDGKMILGAHYSDVDIGEEEIDLWEFAEDNEMVTVSPYFDCDESQQFIGFEIKTTNSVDLNDEFLKELQTKAEKFKEITGADAKLMGLQNVR